MVRNLFFIVPGIVLGLVAVQASAQTASYAFDGDLSDSANNYDGTAFGSSVSFESEGPRSFVHLGANGGVALPTALTGTILSAESLDAAFEFRLDALDSPAILFSVSATGNQSAFWQEAGVKLLVQGGGLVLTFNDGVDPEGYVWRELQPDLEVGQWYSLNLWFDPGRRAWRVDFDGARHQDTFPPAMDTAGMLALLQGTRVTLGGVNGERPSFYAAGVATDELVIHSPIASQPGEINAAFDELRQDLNGTSPLTEPQREARFSLLMHALVFADYPSIASALMSYTNTYEDLNPPLYLDGVDRAFDDLAVHYRVLQVSQQYLFTSQYRPANVGNLIGIVFEHAEVIPGLVPPETPRVASAQVPINGSYSRDVAAEYSDQSRVVRPTGYFAPAGELITLSVDPGVVGHGLSIIVGHHFRNMDYEELGVTNRFPDISVEYPLDQSVINVISPFGGGLYVKVLEGTAAGVFDLTINNAVMSPYFSWRAGQQTAVADWLAQVSASGAPWADFESDKFMLTVPVDVLAGVDNPDAIMTRWDAIMDAARSVAGRPLNRPRAEYYTFDTRLVTPAFGAGYPMVIPLVVLRNQEPWNPLKVLTTPSESILFHEMGHNHLHPTMSFGPGLDPCHFLEAETIVHMLGMAVYANVYGMSEQDAFKKSGVGLDDYSFEEAAFDWLMTPNFRNNQPMIYDESAPMDDKEMLKYQPRSWAKYGDIARLFGWAGLASVNGQFYQAGVEQTSTVCPWRPFVVGRDEYIRAASEALGVNMAPLFHFWGINPSPELADELSSLPNSPEIRQLIMDYWQNVAPQDFNDYLSYHNQMYDRTGYQQPRYDQYLIDFDAEIVHGINSQFRFLLDTYFGLFSDRFENLP